MVVFHLAQEADTVHVGKPEGYPSSQSDINFHLTEYKKSCEENRQRENQKKRLELMWLRLAGWLHYITVSHVGLHTCVSAVTVCTAAAGLQLQLESAEA